MVETRVAPRAARSRPTKARHGEHRVYSTDEQRSQAGCIAARTQRGLRRGPPCSLPSAPSPRPRRDTAVNDLRPRHAARGRCPRRLPARRAAANDLRRGCLPRPGRPAPSTSAAWPAPSDGTDHQPAQPSRGPVPASRAPERGRRLDGAPGGPPAGGRRPDGGRARAPGGRPHGAGGPAGGGGGEPAAPGRPRRAGDRGGDGRPEPRLDAERPGGPGRPPPGPHRRRHAGPSAAGRRAGRGPGSGQHRGGDPGGRGGGRLGRGRRRRGRPVRVEGAAGRDGQRVPAADRPGRPPRRSQAAGVDARPAGDRRRAARGNPADRDGPDGALPGLAGGGGVRRGPRRGRDRRRDRVDSDAPPRRVSQRRGGGGARRL